MAPTVETAAASTKTRITGQKSPAKKAQRSIKKRGEGKSRSTALGLKFPVGRIHRILREGHYAKRISAGSSVYLAAVLEYLCTEVFDCTAQVTTNEKRTRISPRHIMIAIRNDAELDQICKHAIIVNGGVVPFIHQALIPVAGKEAKMKKDRAHSKTSKTTRTGITDKKGTVAVEQKQKEIPKQQEKMTKALAVTTTMMPIPPRMKSPIGEKNHHNRHRA